MIICPPQRKNSSLEFIFISLCAVISSKTEPCVVIREKSILTCSHERRYMNGAHLWKKKTEAFCQCCFVNAVLSIILGGCYIYDSSLSLSRFSSTVSRLRDGYETTYLFWLMLLAIWEFRLIRLWLF